MGDFDGQRWVVMGLGRFGGGLGVARWLVAQGAQVLVTDLDPAEKLEAALAELRPLLDAGVVTLRLGEHNVSDFTTADGVVANPAVPKPWDNRFVRAAQAAGVRVATEIGLLIERLPARERVIGITGTAGKSTTTAMVGHALAEAGAPSVMGGNIGGSLLSDLPRIDARTAVVLELSSAMLWWLCAEDSPARVPGFAPGVAVVTSFAPNHADWHGTLTHYQASKSLILLGQRPGDTAVIHRGVAWPSAVGVRRMDIAGDEFAAPLLLPGAHNRLNASLAAAALRAVGMDEGAIARGIGSFPGLPHRMKLVHEHAGVRFYDDSKSTVPEATLLAIDAAAEDRGMERVHLIAGGYDKKIDLSAIGRLAGSLGSLCVIGTTAASIAGAAGGRAIESGTLERAMRALAARTRDGDAVVLSPGCASWDQFENYEHRGRVFTALARELWS